MRPGQHVWDALMDQCCDAGRAVPLLGRREFLCGASVAALTVAVSPVLRGVATAQVASPLADLGVRPRDEWAQRLAPTGALESERAEDVRFLLVHHTASSNRYARADVPGLIRGFHAAHTGPDRNWPDVAYNFFVDRYGVMWEGRSGILAGPVNPTPPAVVKGLPSCASSATTRPKHPAMRPDYP